jgi:uncharacterized membrane protein YqhA
MSFISKGIMQEIKDVMGVVFSRQMMMALPLLIIVLSAVYFFNTFIDTSYYVDEPIWKVRLK